MKAIQIHHTGGPDVLRYEDVPDPVPQAGEVLVRATAIGVNYLDIYQRSGVYPMTLPAIPGSEGVGVVETAGGGLSAGQRVLWAAQPKSYATCLALPADRLLPVPEGVSDDIALGAGLQALTAQFLCESTYPVKAGEDVLVHAGAGGVGLLLIQMLKAKGARIFTTVSTPEKAALAKEAGATEAILYTQTDFAAAVKAATGGKGVHVVYDSVGKETALASLSVVRPLGMLVLFGNSSGVAPAIDPLALMRQGSVFLTRPTLFHYAADAATLHARAKRVFGWLADGTLKPRIGGVYPLADAAKAHADLEGRKTTGKLVLKV